MKATLKKENLVYYISEGDIIEFISKNAPMDWNECCDFVRDNKITNSEGGMTYWEKEDLLKKPQGYHPEAAKWMKLFFEAHPFLDKIMVVFND